MSFFSSFSLRSSRSSSSSSSSDRNEACEGQSGHSFQEMIKNTGYGHMRKKELDIHIWIQRYQWHWFLVVKWEGSDDLYVILEVTTSTMLDLVKFMRVEDSKVLPKCERVGRLTISFNQLCEIADSVVSDMGTYNLFKRNCQHFCNNLLKRLNMKCDYETTIGPTTTIHVQPEAHGADADEGNKEYLTPERLQQLYEYVFSKGSAAKKTGKFSASVLGLIVGAHLTGKEIVVYK